MSKKSLEVVHVDYRQLFESAPALYLALRAQDFQIVAASDAYLLATMTNREQIIGKSIFEVFPDDPHEARADGTRNLRASLERVKSARVLDVMAVQRYPIRRPESQGGGFEERWWSPVNSPVFDQSGTISFIIHRVEDVTPVIRELLKQGKKAEGLKAIESRFQHIATEILMRTQELQQANERLQDTQTRLQAANRDLREFAAVVSHDLKSPLRAVANLASWIQSDSGDKLDPEARENLAEIRRRVARMDRMIEEILDYSRLGWAAESIEAVPLDDLVAGVVRDLHPADHVRVLIDPDMPTVHGEPVRLRQVFQNLIDNAIKHADKPQIEIKVKWAESGPYWKFSVADNGPGIEERHFERIFKLFQTLATKDKADSTGMGLAITRRIVERACGSIWVESQVGKGTTFHFTWPKRLRTGCEEGDDESAGRPGSELLSAL